MSILIVAWLLAAGEPALSPTRAAADQPASLAEIKSIFDMAQPTRAEQRRARELLDQELLEHPNDPALRFYDGEFWDRGGADDKALAIWNPLADNLPANDDSPWIAACLARVAAAALEKGDLDRAEKMTAEWIRRSPADADAYELGLNVAFQQGESKRFQHELVSAAQQHPELTELALRSLAETGEWKQLEELVTTWESDPSRLSELPLARARLAAMQRNDELAAALYFRAAQVGSTRSGSAHQARRWLEDRIRRAAKGQLQGDLATVFAAYAEIEQPRRAEEAVKSLRSLSPSSPDFKIMVDHLIAVGNETAENWPAAAKAWKETLLADQQYVPGLLGVSDYLALEHKDEASDRFLERARKLAPDSRGVQERIRLGGHYRLTDSGIAIRSIGPGTPLERFGLKPGDLVLELNSLPLASMSDAERLRTMRLFQGGSVLFQRPGEAPKRIETEILFFE